MSTDNHEGTVIDGRYEVLSRIARGGMATVFLARDRRLDRDVAVKVMHPHLAESETFIARFRREARAAARLSHPNAVAVFDQGLWEESFYLTMEYVDGEDLRDALRRRGSLPVGEALSVVERVLDALAAAHRRDLIHRDIKPENVLLTREGTPKLADFGLARAVSDATAASTGTVLGTVAYLAPELVTSGTASAASDIYAVGVMLYELLTGRQPFAGDVPINIAFQHVTSSVPAVSETIPELPREIDDLIGALTARDAAERLPDGDAARAALMRVQESLSEESAALRADVEGVPDAAVSETNVDPDLSDGPNGTTPLWIKPSTGTAAIPIGEAQLATITPGSGTTPKRAKLKRRRWPIVLAVLLLTLLAGGGATAYYYLFGPGSMTEVPVTRGHDQATAEDILRIWDLTAVIEQEHSDTTPSGNVIRSNPEPGEAARKNSEVTLVVSLGIEKHSMPDVVGLNEEAALNDLASFAEPEITREWHPTVPEGQVLSIEIAHEFRSPDGERFTPGDAPEPETLVPHTVVFALVISQGREPVTDVPDVTGETLEDAIAALEEVRLEVQEANEREYDDEIPEGSVISQDAPENVYVGDTITLTVSQGPELVQVPNVFRMSSQQAIETLEEAGLEAQVEEGWLNLLDTVRRQDIPAGDWVPKGTTVTIQVL